MKTRRRTDKKKKNRVLELRLYVADTTARSVLAKGNLQRLCEQNLQQPYLLRVVDLVKHPERAREDEITAIPALMRVFPGPRRLVIGTLSDPNQVLRALEVRSQPESFSSLLSRAGSQIGNA